LLCIGYELSLNIPLSEPQYSLCCTIKETDSKAEQGNDNLIACDSNDDLTATENNSTKSVTIMMRDAVAIAAAAAAAVP